MSIVEALRSLENTSSTLQKKKILLHHKDDALAKEILVAALDPYVTYGILVDNPPPLGMGGNVAAWWKSAKRLLEMLRTRELTGNKARQSVDRAVESQFGWLFARIVNKDLRCGVQAKTVNASIPGLIPEFTPALATEGATVVDGKLSLSVKALAYPLLAEWKLDGLRAIAIKGHGVVTLYSRKGLVLDNYPHINEAVAALPVDNIVLDGEALGKDFTATVKAKRRKDGKTDTGINLWVFDALPLGDWISRESVWKQRNRSDKIMQLLEDEPEHLRLVPQVWIDSEKELIDAFQKARAEGVEGLVLKDPDATYAFKRSKCWLKVKEFETVDVEVTGLEEGDGKHKGTLGALVCKFKGKEVRVGSGFTDAQRKQIWTQGDAVHGRVIEIRFQEVASQGGARFPTFQRFRDDKEAE